MEANVFEFRIINLSDDTQVIDRTLKTPYEALTAVQMAEYMEVNVQLDYMDRIKRRERMEMQRRQKLARNPIYRLRCLCRLVITSRNLNE